MRFTAIFVLALMLCVVANNLHAAYPLFTDDAGVVQKESYELEAACDYCVDENESLDRSYGISFKHGITERMDFGVSFPYQMDVDGGQNMGAASISFKFSLVEDMVSVSFSNELGEKSYFLNAIYTKKLFGVGCNLNAGYLSAGAGNTRGEGSCGMSVEIPVKDFDVVGELISREGGRGNGLIGARYRIGDALFVAAGFLKDFELDSRKYTIGLHAEF